MHKTKHTTLSTIWLTHDQGEAAGNSGRPPVTAQMRSQKRESEPEPLLLTVEEAARMLRLGRTVVYELMQKGELHSIKIGRTRRVVRASIGEYVSRLLDEAV